MWISKALWSRSSNPDGFWKKRRLFRMTAHFYGRKRNCYSIGIRYCKRALAYSSKGRKLKKADIKELWEQRIQAGCAEFGASYEQLVKGLTRCHLALDRRTISNLAIWEPRSFKSLLRVSLAALQQEQLSGVNSIEPPSAGVITRGML
nr:EOG090X0H9C [Chydorus sphaericus]